MILHEVWRTHASRQDHVANAYCLGLDLPPAVVITHGAGKSHGNVESADSKDARDSKHGKS
jgi:hypothetical protein